LFITDNNWRLFYSQILRAPKIYYPPNASIYAGVRNHYVSKNFQDFVEQNTVHHFTKLSNQGIRVTPYYSPNNIGLKTQPNPDVVFHLNDHLVIGSDMKRPSKLGNGQILPIGKKSFDHLLFQIESNLNIKYVRFTIR